MQMVFTKQTGHAFNQIEFIGLVCGVFRSTITIILQILCVFFILFIVYIVCIVRACMRACFAVKTIFELVKVNHL